jgi:hypothetical protein
MITRRKPPPSSAQWALRYRYSQRRDPVAAIENAEMVIVGGGNTFQLLKECRERGLLAPIVDVVKRGALYIGWSAGATSPARPFAPPTICRLSTQRFCCAGAVPAAD